MGNRINPKRSARHDRDALIDERVRHEARRSSPAHAGAPGADNGNKCLGGVQALELTPIKITSGW